MIGHNSGTPDPLDSSDEALVAALPAADQLRLLIERAERLQDEKKGIADDERDVFSEMKSAGFDVKTVRTIIRLRKMEKHHRDEMDMLVSTYREAMGI